MASTPVLGAGPVEFVDTDSGSQVSIALSALSFAPDGTVDASAWGGYAQYQAVVDPLLRALVRTGALKPGESPAPQPALVLTALHKGSSGNNIRVTFSNSGADPNDTQKFDVEAVETDSWTRLTIDAVEKVLGTAADATPSAGLVFVSQGSSAGHQRPKNATYKVDAGNKVEVVEDDGNTVAFELVPRDAGADAQLITMVVSNAADPDPHFDLTATWRKTAAGIHPGDLAAAIGYVVKVDAPQGAQGPRTPGNGTVILRGGSAAADPAAATATVSGAA